MWHSITCLLSFCPWTGGPQCGCATSLSLPHKAKLRNLACLYSYLNYIQIQKFRKFQLFTRKLWPSKIMLITSSKYLLKQPACSKKCLNNKSPNKVVSKSEEITWQQDEQTVGIMLKLTMQSLLHKLPWKVKDIVVKQYHKWIFTILTGSCRIEYHGTLYKQTCFIVYDIAHLWCIWCVHQLQQ